MRPDDVTTRIFLDGGDPAETRRLLTILGFLDGQTTNPSLVAKNPELRARIESGGKLSQEELVGFYRDMVRDIKGLIPEGSVSIEVYADHKTPAEAMIDQGLEFSSWIPGAQVKLPTTRAGLEAAERLVAQNVRVNMTLCFTLAQAAAVYLATKGATPGQVFVSPFLGRLDDQGLNGTDLIAHIMRLYSKGDGHVLVLAASLRSMRHLMECLRLGCDILTAPYGLLAEWGLAGSPMPLATSSRSADLAPIPYVDLDLEGDWRALDIGHELTDKGLKRFADDWNSLLS